MLIESHLIHDHLLMCVAMDILVDNSKDFFDEFMNRFEASKNRIRRVTLDFSNVRFLDSSGIGTVIKASNKVKEAGIEIFVLNLNKTLVSVFRLSGLENILPSMEKEDFIRRYPEFEEVLRKNHEI